jgi:hypothetical protein
VSPGRNPSFFCEVYEDCHLVRTGEYDIVIYNFFISIMRSTETLFCYQNNASRNSTRGLKVAPNLEIYTEFLSKFGGLLFRSKPVVYIY